jgi:hypothetical protein
LFTLGKDENLRQTSGRFVSLAGIALLCISVVAQQNPAVSAKPTDKFLGSWKLNVEKSPLGPVAENVTVKLEGKQLRSSVDVKRRDGSESTGRIESRYTVSPDGKTLTKRVISGGGPPSLGNQVLVFDRVP